MYILCCVCIFSVFHLVNHVPKDPYKGNRFLSPSLCLAHDFRTRKKAPLEAANNPWLLPLKSPQLPDLQP